MNTSTSSPEIGRRVEAAGFSTNYHDMGEGRPLLLVHGSGPGVTGWANWRLNMPYLAQHARVLAPDMAGFGYTPAPPGVPLTMDTWVEQLIAFMDALDIEQTDLVGNSFGGALALAVTLRHPQRVRRLVLMGSVGVSFPITPGLDAVWGYTPSIENMRHLLSIFAYDQSLVSDGLAQMRYEASLRPGAQESFSAMFSPGPRQRFVEAMASPEEAIRGIQHETLVLHGRDDQVIPVSNSERLARLIPNAQLHIFPRCGHWTQIEWKDTFNAMVAHFIGS